MKKKIIIVVIILCAISILMISLNSNKRLNIDFLKKTQTKINNNNYSNFNNTIDYAYDKFAFIEYGIFKTKLTVVDGKSKYKTFYGIDSPFRIYKDNILYIKNNELISINIETRKKTVLIDNVGDFKIFNDAVIYMTKGYPDEYKTLYTYDINKKVKKAVCENVQEFCIYKERLFVVNKNEMLLEVSLNDFSIKEVIKLKIKAYPYSIMMQGEKLILDDSSRQFDIIDLNEKSITSFSIAQGTYINDRLAMICDDNNFYYSFQATKTDGSLVMDVNDENNGLWSVNLNTLEKEKILTQTFSSLYLYEDGLLIGIKDNDIFKIDIENKKYLKIN